MMRLAKMHVGNRRSALPRFLLYSLLSSLLSSLTAASQQIPDWRYNDPHYDSAQYAKILGQTTSDENNGKGPGQDQYGPFQYQYVDYQPNCREGGQPVCATNGNNYFYFENDCKLEAHNMKMLFQHGTELELTDFGRCMPNCGNIKCNNLYEPVCAATVSGRHQGHGVTFANECEVRRRECDTKETMRFLNKGPCKNSRSKLRSKGKRKHGKNRRNKGNTSTTDATVEATTITSNSIPAPKKLYLLLTEAPTTTTTSTSTTTTTTPAPMQFRQMISNSDVSVSRAVNPYSVFSIEDVGVDYDAVKDTSLSIYLPGIGTVTDTPPSTTSTTTTTTSTTTTTTPEPETTTVSTTELPSSSSTAYTTAPPATSTTSTTQKSIINIIYIPYKKSSTTSPKPSMSTFVNSITSTSTPSTNSTN
ncbi:hypothetical protein KR222_009144, partial [Zaprionus bogoriensis]